MHKMELDKAVVEIQKKASKLLKTKQVVFIGIAGGSGSGKTFLAKKLDAKILSMDDYYLGIDKIKDQNFDHPTALKLDLLRKHMIMLKQNKSISKPAYDFTTHARKGYENFEPSKTIIIEGLFALNSAINDILDVKVFIDAATGIRLQRRIDRDMKERGRTKESIISQFDSTVEPMYLKHVLPTKKFADLIIEN